MKHHAAALLCAISTACAATPITGTPGAVTGRGPEVAESAAPSPANSCPAKTETLYVPPMPQPGFVPAPARGATVVAPRRLHAASPAYSSASQRCREQGKVTITYCVSAEGDVENVQVLISSGYARLDNAVLAWAARDRHTAGMVNGRARLYCGLVAEQEFNLPEAAIGRSAR